MILKSIADAMIELEQYEGLPKCQDCGWKLGTAITDNCSCRGNLTSEQKKAHNQAFERARDLQRIVYQNPNL